MHCWNKSSEKSSDMSVRNIVKFVLMKHYYRAPPKPLKNYEKQKKKNKKKKKEKRRRKKKRNKCMRVSQAI